MPTGSEIRETFLRFFESKGHKRVHSSSLVPANDPTLLFTNAGMNQFKDVFLGIEKRDYSRAATSQKCVRAGGKHNDLENVGFTKRHHTFFEMLGNFSFGDYFKREAIAYAWELVTSKDWYGVPKERLYCTIFKGDDGVPRDDDAENFWQQAGVSKDRIFAMGMKDNFWSMGDTGPCGPCSEIHYDMGAAASDEGHTDCKFPCECGRYVEIWNLVFMQFDRDAQGTLNPLPKPSIDTGMGLERLSAVLQGKLSNYETDLFTPLIQAAAKLTGVDLGRELAAERGSKSAASLRVIADHARATTFLISDGVLPANEGRGYVLRKILRRGIRHGRLLGATKPFMYQMVFAVRDLMKDAYPELAESADRVSRVVHEEERRFAHTLDEGLSRLEADLQAVRRTMADAQRAVTEQEPLTDSGVGRAQMAQYQYQTERGMRYRGDHAFKLYDTFGLPFDFIMDACRDAGIALDVEGFERAMEAQRERARASWKGGAKQTASPVFRNLSKTVFEGYRQTESDDCEILALVKTQDGASQGVQALNAGEEGEVVLDHTPFYADSGGQVGDIGVFFNQERNAALADVNGCYMPVQGVRAHKVKARQPLRVGMKVDAVVHTEVRESTMRNHTATHLLHAGLREVLGKHVKQAGSLVDPARLRFDFSHFTSVADEELQDIEDLINKEVLRNIKVQVIEDVPIDVAINEYKAMALFGEKYGERVRVIKIGDFSTELCGGTHTGATGEIGLIKIMSEGSVSSGVRRVEAITGESSLHHFRKDHELESVVSTLVPKAQQAGSPAAALRGELDKREAEIRKLQKELEQLRMKSAASTMASIDDKIKDVRGVKVLAHRVDNLERGQMRTLVDNLRNKLGSGVVVLGSAADGKVSLIVGVTADLTGRIQAGKVIKPVAEKVGGSGGGRPDMAEAGGKDPEHLDAALNEAYAAVETLLK
ncbi:MAG TPA: alanine--tRNA ligase [Candidatus Limnocylindrales bacterium]|nr:alanine--tRNA ligase [Candidatus Limnocylindrales bacterium]